MSIPPPPIQCCVPLFVKFDEYWYSNRENNIDWGGGRGEGEGCGIMCNKLYRLIYVLKLHVSQQLLKVIVDAIRDFPSPISTTDIRSWFGLVNQVTNYAQLRDIMAPFKPFLSPRCKFHWSPELEEAFYTTSKEAIVEAIRKVVEIFDIHKRTCLRPDWSSRGIDYFLLFHLGLFHRLCYCDLQLSLETGSFTAQFDR